MLRAAHDQDLPVGQRAVAGAVDDVVGVGVGLVERGDHQRAGSQIGRGIEDPAGPVLAAAGAADTAGFRLAAPPVDQHLAVAGPQGGVDGRDIPSALRLAGGKAVRVVAQEDDGSPGPAQRRHRLAGHRDVVEPGRATVGDEANPPAGHLLVPVRVGRAQQHERPAVGRDEAFEVLPLHRQPEPLRPADRVVERPRAERGPAVVPAPADEPALDATLAPQQQLVIVVRVLHAPHQADRPAAIVRDGHLRFDPVVAPARIPRHRQRKLPPPRRVLPAPAVRLADVPFSRRRIPLRHLPALEVVEEHARRFGRGRGRRVAHPLLASHRRQ